MSERMPGPKKSDNKETRHLVVQDNADDRELLLRQLRKAGLANHMKFVTAGKEALRPVFKNQKS